MDLRLQTLYKKAFNIQPKHYPEFDTKDKVLPYETPDKIDVYYQGKSNALMSVFGTPISMPFKIDNIWLDNEPLVTLTGGKKIVKTVVAGLKGTVKEEINDNDYLIVIKGIITNGNSDDYPEPTVSELRYVLEQKGSHKVVNKLLKIFGIDEMVIEHFNIFGIEGHQSQQAYQISGWSDRPVELVIKEGL